MTPDQPHLEGPEWVVLVRCVIQYPPTFRPDTPVFYEIGIDSSSGNPRVRAQG